MKRIVVATTAGVALAAVIGMGIAGAATGTGPGGAVADALASLVGDGTLTQAQADKVSSAIEKERAERYAEHKEKRAERQEKRQEYRAEFDEVLQDVLGLNSEEVRKQLAAGKTLGEIVGDSNDELAAALADLVDENLKEAVSAGRLTQAQADRFAELAKARIDKVLADDSPWLDASGLGALAMLGQGRGLGGFGMGHHRGHGHWLDKGEDAGEQSPAPTSSAI